MRHVGLKARMATVGSLLFGFYGVAAVVLMGMFGEGALPLILAGSAPSPNIPINTTAATP